MTMSGTRGCGVAVMLQVPIRPLSLVAALVVLLHVLVGHTVLQAHAPGGGPGPFETVEMTHHHNTGHGALRPSAVIDHETVTLHHDSGCQQPGWVTQRLNPLHDLAMLAAACVAIMAPSIIDSTTSLPRFDPPRPDGPGRQALLQRFTL